jgi:hypothetical protein
LSAMESSHWHRPKLGCLSPFELDSSVQVYARQSEVISCHFQKLTALAHPRISLA